MTAMRPPQMPHTMPAVSVQVTVTMTTLNAAQQKSDDQPVSKVAHVGGGGGEQWRFLSMYLLMMQPPKGLQDITATIREWAGWAVCSYFGHTNENMRACSYCDCVFLCRAGV